MTKKLLILGLAAALMLAMLVTGCGSKPEYDPSQYVTLEYKYFNGEGVAEPVVTPPVGDNKEAAKVIVLLEKTRFIYAPDNKLSNGDVVTVTPVYDEEEAKKQGFEPVVKETKFTVEGLPEGTPVDLWEPVTVTFKGQNGDGKFTVYSTKGVDDTALLKFIANGRKVKWDKSKDLSNGDVVTGTVTYDAEMARQMGFKITSEPTKQFTVTGLK